MQSYTHTSRASGETHTLPVAVEVDYIRQKTRAARPRRSVHYQGYLYTHRGGRYTPLHRCKISAGGTSSPPPAIRALSRVPTHTHRRPLRTVTYMHCALSRVPTFSRGRRPRRGACMRICMYMSVCMHAYVHVYVCMHACVYACICLYACMRIRMQMCETDW